MRDRESLTTWGEEAQNKEERNLYWTHEDMWNVQLVNVYERRESLLLKFAKKSLKLTQFKSLLPVKKQMHNMKTRNQQKFIVNSACTERYKKSSVPAMQRVLNDLDKNFKSVSESLYPVTNEICQFGSLVVKI